MQTIIRITEDLDADIRRRIAELFSQAPAIAFPDGPVTGWVPAADSLATQARGIVLPSFAGTQVAEGGIDLPLSIAHGFLREVANQIATTAFITVMPPQVRWATLGPIARAAAERGATVRWLFSAPTEHQRLARGYVVEIRGAQNHLKWLGEDADVHRWMEELVVSAVDEVGGGIETDRLGLTVGVAGERIPSLTELIRGASSTEGATDRSYAELSIFTHPTGLSARAYNTSNHYVEHRQLMFEPDASMHAEGRLMNDCILAFATATALVHSYIGRDSSTALTSWLLPIAELWIEWCDANGCKDHEQASTEQDQTDNG